ncbi:hypothetical protein FCK90_02925 [Kocuria coralli]|uniref:DUF4878 domain-containing protein n=1 Tax=Kocuria coralli TaxID=1461025 RepID=A0A5J5L093_9MICC|nr:hypothetical protein [Kocuria coralli]KAA9395369.1 hypothetical protein FCK90_02925 [Kocuria coralli]
MEGNDRIGRAVGAWFFLVLLAVAAAWVTISLVNKYMYGPETDVRTYFTHLEEGDGARALGAINAQVPSGTDATLLDGDALRQATETLSDVEISTVSQDADSAVVRADYTLDGQEHSTEYHLHPADTQWGFFTVWSFDETPLPTLTVSMPGVTSIDINDTSAAMPDSTQEFAALPPGLYTASYASEYVDAEPESIALTAPDQDESATLAARPSQKMTDEVQRSISADLKQCTDQRTLFPADCPFSHEFGGRVQGTPTWKIVEQPEPEISVSAGSDTGWSLSEARGVAEVSFTSVDLYDGTTEEHTERVPFTYQATIGFDDQGEPEISR